MVCIICKNSETRSRADRMLMDGASVRDVAAGIAASKSAVDRHKRGCLAKTLLVAAAPGAEVDVTPSSADTQPIQSRALETPADYWRYKQWLLDHATTLVERTAAADNPRLHGDAIKTASALADSFAEGRGWVQKNQPLQDNRSVNIFASMPPEALMALRDALSA